MNDKTRELVAALEEYMRAFPAFRIKPIGAPGSQAREDQEFLVGLENRAVAAIKAAL